MIASVPVNDDELAMEIDTSVPNSLSTFAYQYHDASATFHLDALSANQMHSGQYESWDLRNFDGHSKHQGVSSNCQLSQVNDVPIAFQSPIYSSSWQNNDWPHSTVIAEPGHQPVLASGPPGEQFWEDWIVEDDQYQGDVVNSGFSSNN